MGFSLSDLFISIVLMLNGLAILNEQRFLAKIGWTYDQANQITLKGKLIHLISAIRTLMRIPLIIVNILIIFFEILLG